MSFKKVFLLTLVIVITVSAAAIFIINIKASSSEAFSSQAAQAAQVTEEPGMTKNEEASLPVQSLPEKPSVENREPVVLNITAVGDILLGRGVSWWLAKQQKGYTYPFEKVKDILKKGDVIFGNLEEPFTSSEHSLTGIEQKGKYVLKNSPEAFYGIKYAGFNLLNLANNHILDYYDTGLYDTLKILDSDNIAHSGAGKDLDEARKPAIIEKNSIKIGMLSYTDMADIVYKGNPQISFIAGKSRAGVAPRNMDYILKDIGQLRSQVDIVIISLHWGVEDSFAVQPQQVEFAHKLLDSGADMILGHHPHHFQGIEIYKGKPIAYSLGNFIFDQNSPENQESFILQMEYKDKKLTNFSAIPIKTISKSQVVPQTGQGAQAMLNRELDLSRKLNSKCSIKEDKLIFDLK